MYIYIYVFVYVHMTASLVLGILAPPEVPSESAGFWERRWFRVVLMCLRRVMPQVGLVALGNPGLCICINNMCTCLCLHVFFLHVYVHVYVLHIYIYINSIFYVYVNELYLLMYQFEHPRNPRCQRGGSCASHGRTFSPCSSA